MKYRRVVVTRRGGPEVLRVIEDDLPEPAAGQVRVKVLAAGVAFGDVMRRALLSGAGGKPRTLGYDIVGRVDQPGEGVTTVYPGQSIAALPVEGGYAEYLNLPATELIPVPDHLDPAEAVCMTLNYLTAYQLLHRLADVKEGQRILIHAAAGGVGTALLQLGRLAGVEMYGTASAGKHQIVRDFGAMPIDYHKEDVAALMRELGGVDVVFDGVGGARNLWGSYQALRAGGQLICYGFSSAARHGETHLLSIMGSAALLMAILPLQGKSIKVYSVTGMKNRHPEWYREDVMTLFDLLAQRKIQPVISQRLPLEQAALAHVLLEGAARIGKIVLMMQ